MNFHLLEGAHHLSNIEWVLRAVLAYIFLMIIGKAMGQRSIAQFRVLDVVLVLLLGGNVSNALSDEKVGLLGSMITTFVIVMLHIANSIVALKWDMWRRFLEPAPIILIHNGHIYFNNLKKARITVEYLFAELRVQNIADVKMVKMALWESSGLVSAFLYAEHEPATRKDMKIESSAQTVPFVVIKEGNIQQDSLALLGKTEGWIKEAMQSISPIEDVKLATLDASGEIKVIEKE
ncbi:membrane protein [Bacillus manliponensis]|uniref:Membrane protein n=1 Tax=Bacillus manliponensis TaxID=574376 RepID=A0A073K1E4_9BACI|nr:YetF domain-containing protein [Bacillus manliponensis]KEK21139.1 membrane protein [Bacillus manliponensis]